MIDNFDCSKPSDFLIKPRCMTDFDFYELSTLVDNFHFTEINILNILYENLHLKKNSKKDFYMSDIGKKIGYFPDVVSHHLKSLIKNQIIELLITSELDTRNIMVKFTDKGLNQVIKIRKLFCTCKFCGKLYKYPIQENFNDSDEVFCSHNCKHNSSFDKEIQDILLNGLSFIDWLNSDYPIISDDLLNNAGFKCILEGDHDEIHYFAFRNKVKETYQAHTKVYPKIYNVYDDDNYDVAIWIKN